MTDTRETRKAPPHATAEAPPKSPATVHIWLALCGSVIGGILYFVGYAGMNIWPLSFVAILPFWISIRGQTPKAAAWLGLVFGLTMNLGGFYWLLTMLQTFSGFPTIACLFFVVVICAFQGSRYAFTGWLYARAERRGWGKTLAFISAMVAGELVYPLLFTWYFGASVHQVPVLIQSADLGGPILVSLVLIAVNLALAEPILARLERRKVNVRYIGICAGAFVLNLAYGAMRIPQVDARAEAAESAHVGIVQGNMGLMQKREDPGEGLRRHKKLTAELKQKGIDFVVWSESSVTFAVPEQMYKKFMHDRVSGSLGVPAIFGAVVFRHDKDRERWFNTALVADDKGEVQGRYDKEFLLAFGEYLPFGDTFPILYKWSPNSGKFSAGTSLDPLRVVIKGKERTITMLICYEDISPRFTNSAVAAGNPDLLVNITNDAWFGDSTEPWEHLALSEFRAIEHRRYFVRATNSGVSAIIDPVGRVVTHTGTFVVEAKDGVVKFMKSSTVYETLGDFPWILLSLFSFAAAFMKKKTKPAELKAAA